MVKDVKGGFLIKPNCNTDDPYPQDTHPGTVRTIAESLLSAGVPANRIVLGETSGRARGLPTRHTMENLGMLEVAGGSLMEGLDLLRAAVRRDPDDWKVHDDLAALYLRLGRADDAIRELRLALARNPFYLAGYDGLSGIHAAYGEGRMASFYRGRKERVASAAAAASTDRGREGH